MSDLNSKLPSSSAKSKENESNHPGASPTLQVATIHPLEDNTSMLSFLVRPRPANTNESRNDATLHPRNRHDDDDNQSIMSQIVSKPAVIAETTDRPTEAPRPRKESQEKESILSFIVSKPKPVLVPPGQTENRGNPDNSETVREAAKPPKNEKVKTKTNKARELPPPLKEKREHSKDFSILEGFARFFARSKKEASPTESILLKTYQPSFVDRTVQTSEVRNDSSTTLESLEQAIDKLQRLHSVIGRMMNEIKQSEGKNESSDNSSSRNPSPKEKVDPKKSQSKLKGKESVEEILPSRNTAFSANSSREESPSNSTELVTAQNAQTPPPIKVRELDHEAGPRSARSQGDRVDFNDPHMELLDDKQLDGKEPAEGINAARDGVEVSADKHSDKKKSLKAGTKPEKDGVESSADKNSDENDTSEGTKAGKDGVRKSPKRNSNENDTSEGTKAGKDGARKSPKKNSDEIESPEYTRAQKGGDEISHRKHSNETEPPEGIKGQYDVGEVSRRKHSDSDLTESSEETEAKKDGKLPADKQSDGKKSTEGSKNEKGNIEVSPQKHSDEKKSSEVTKKGKEDSVGVSSQKPSDEKKSEYTRAQKDGDEVSPRKHSDLTESSEKIEAKKGGKLPADKQSEGKKSSEVTKNKKDSVGVSSRKPSDEKSPEYTRAQKDGDEVSHRKHSDETESSEEIEAKKGGKLSADKHSEGKKSSEGTNDEKDNVGVSSQMPSEENKSPEYNGTQKDGDDDEVSSRKHLDETESPEETKAKPNGTVPANTHSEGKKSSEGKRAGTDGVEVSANKHSDEKETLEGTIDGKKGIHVILQMEDRRFSHPIPRNTSIGGHSSTRENALNSTELELHTEQNAPTRPFTKGRKSDYEANDSSGRGSLGEKNDAEKLQSNRRGKESAEEILPSKNTSFGGPSSRRESAVNTSEPITGQNAQTPPFEVAESEPPPLTEKRELTKDFSILDGFARYFTRSSGKDSPEDKNDELKPQSALREESVKEILPSRNATFSVLSSRRESAVNSTELVTGQNSHTLSSREVAESDHEADLRPVRSQGEHADFNDTYKNEIVAEVLTIIRGELLDDKHLNVKESSEKTKTKKGVDDTTQTEDRLYSYRILRNACLSFGCHCNEKESNELVTRRSVQTTNFSQVTESDHEDSNEPHMKEEIVAEVLTIIRGEILDDKHVDVKESSEETKAAGKEGVEVSIQTEYRRFPYRPEDYGSGSNPDPLPIPASRPCDCRRPASCADCKVEGQDQTQFCTSFSGNNVRCESPLEPSSNCFCPHPQSPIINVEWASNQSVGDNAAVPLQEAFKQFHTVCYQRVCMRQQSIANSKRRRELSKTVAEARCPCPCPHQNRHSSTVATASAKQGSRGGKRSSRPCPGPAKGSQKRGKELVSTDKKCECKEVDPCEPFTYVVPKDQVYWQWI